MVTETPAWTLSTVYGPDSTAAPSPLGVSEM